MSKCFFIRGTQVWEKRDLTGIKEGVIFRDAYITAEEIGNGICRIYDDAGTIGYAKKSSDKGAKPWYQIFGDGTFKGAGLGVEFMKLPGWLRYLLYGAIALAIAYVYKKLKK